MRQGTKNPMADRIKELRTGLGITQKELAKEIGISYASVVDYENGRREPNSKAMAALERYFGVSGEFLRGDVDRDAFMENIPVIHAELDRVIARMGQFKDAYTVSNQTSKPWLPAYYPRPLSLLQKTSCSRTSRSIWITRKLQGRLPLSFN